MAAGEEPAAASQRPQGRLRSGLRTAGSCADVLGERELADAARAVDQQGVRQALARAPSAIRRSARSRDGSFEPSGQSSARSRLLRMLAHVRGGVDDPHRARARPWRARGTRPRTRSKKAASSRSKRSSFFPEPGEALAAPPRSGSRRRSVRSGARPGCAAALSRSMSSSAHAVAGALVGVGRVGEAVADHPAARVERRRDDAARRGRARAAKMSSVSAIGSMRLLEDRLAQLLGELGAAGLARDDRRARPDAAATRVGDELRRASTCPRRRRLRG